jgi:hypothetical protein
VYTVCTRESNLSVLDSLLVLRRLRAVFCDILSEVGRTNVISDQAFIVSFSAAVAH